LCFNWFSIDQVQNSVRKPDREKWRSGASHMPEKLLNGAWEHPVQPAQADGPLFLKVIRESHG
jgi:hypothetical protein